MLCAGRQFIRLVGVACRGSADMLLLLLNDENNAVVGEGLELIMQRERDAATVTGASAPDNQQSAGAPLG